MTVAVTSRPLDPDERWHYIFSCACRDYRMIVRLIEVAPVVWERIAKVMNDLIEAMTKMCYVFVEGIREILPTLQEVVTVATYPQSPQSFPQRRKPRPARKNYLRLNTIGYCPRVRPCARSRC